MRLFEVSLIKKVSRKGERSHHVANKVVMAEDAGQARERAVASGIPDEVVAVLVEEAADPCVYDAHGGSMQAADVRRILKAPGEWTVLTTDLALPERPPLRL